MPRFRSLLCVTALAVLGVCLGPGAGRSDPSTLNRLWTRCAGALIRLSTRHSSVQRFTRLFNGKDLAGFKLVGTPESTWKVVDGVIVCSGEPQGYLATEKSYRTYVLRFDWRYRRPENLQKDGDFDGNSGLLIQIAEHKVWPKCIEVQLMNKDAGNIFALLGGKATAKKDSAAQARAIKPVGEWNREEVTVTAEKISCRINGELICEATDYDPKEGPIGWQSEGREIHFRNILIREM